MHMLLIPLIQNNWLFTDINTSTLSKHACNSILNISNTRDKLLIWVVSPINGTNHNWLEHAHRKVDLDRNLVWIRKLISTIAHAENLDTLTSTSAFRLELKCLFRCFWSIPILAIYTIYCINWNISQTCLLFNYFSLHSFYFPCVSLVHIHSLYSSLMFYFCTKLISISNQ